VSGEDILVHYGLQNLSHLTEEHLVTVCPALLNQGVLPPCSTEPPVLTDPTELHGESLHVLKNLDQYTHTHTHTHTHMTEGEWCSAITDLHMMSKTFLLM